MATYTSRNPTSGMHLDVSGSDTAEFTSTHNSGYQIVESGGVADNTSVWAGGAEYAGAGGEDVLADDHQGGAFVKFV
jgi:autotransporter passenger strand-loop-strand repeat protein